MIAIDLGSNTFRAIEMACDTFETVAEFERVVRTADGLHQTGKISDTAVERIIEATEDAKKVLDFSQKVVAVTTEAIRKASNAQEVLDTIANRTGVNFRLIPGEEEAKYTLLAVISRFEKLGLKCNTFVMVDIGGGSTEVVFYDRGRVLIESFPVGILTVAQAYGSPEAIQKALPTLMQSMSDHVAKAKAEGFAPDCFISTAGTPTTIAAMKLGMDYKTYDPQRINGTQLTREDLDRELTKLLALDKEERQKLVGVGREDLIAAGVLIFDQLYQILNFELATVIDDGLREGVAIAECRQLKIHEIFH